MRTKHQTFSVLKAAEGAPEGSFEAVFSTFGIVDADGEVVMREALEPHDGKEIPIVWGHNWQGPAIGKGTIEVDQDRARILGQFNMQTDAGREAHGTVKFMGGLQEYSWGFGVTEIDSVEIDGTGYPAITGVEPIEVSPVLVGSNPETGTLDIKGTACPTCGQALRRTSGSDLTIIVDNSNADADAKAAALKEVELAAVDIAAIGL